ncbi:MAG: hypothetical protein CFE31_08865 [Rhizobiales bacterium PAR1]|nr:MAG: hypothetical protein CFE31_08865 [Rhizobiales bacterium PAR1]
MSMIPHVFRRGAIYCWRRRLPRTFSFITDPNAWFEALIRERLHPRRTISRLFSFGRFVGASFVDGLVDLLGQMARMNAVLQA